MSITAASIDDLADAEVAALTEAEITLLIKRAMAEAGIPVLPLPTEPDYLPVPAPDLAVYEVVGEHFTDRTAAEHVQQAINEASGYRVRLAYSRNYSARYVESNDSDVQVTTRMVYSPQTHALHKEALDENAVRKDAYEIEQRAYRAAEEGAAGIRADVRDRIDTVQEHARRIAMLADRFVEYQAIANGDDKMAMQFLVKAFGLDEPTVDAVWAAVR